MTETVTTNVSAAMRDAVGREVSRRTSYPVTESDIRRWALAVYWPGEPPRLFVERSEAMVAPEDFNPFAWAVAESVSSSGRPEVDANDPDSIEITLGVPGPGLAHQLNGGIRATYGRAVRPGDVITSVTTLSGYKERSGSLGTMLITTTEDLWTNQDGAVVKSTALTLIRY